jgi:hypothetical protein
MLVRLGTSGIIRALAGAIQRSSTLRSALAPSQGNARLCTRWEGEFLVRSLDGEAFGRLAMHVRRGTAPAVGGRRAPADMHSTASCDLAAELRSGRAPLCPPKKHELV